MINGKIKGAISRIPRKGSFLSNLSKGGKAISINLTFKERNISKKIAKDLKNLLNPFWLRIAGIWYPRGGIPIDVFWQTAKEPRDLFIPMLNTSQYRGRD
mgnify:CR=1 FL=1